MSANSDTPSISPDHLRTLGCDMAPTGRRCFFPANMQAEVSLALFWAADEIERLQEHLAAAELGLPIVQRAKP